MPQPELAHHDDWKTNADGNPKNEDQLVLGFLEQLIKQERTPETCSSLAYYKAKLDKNYGEAIPLIREALGNAPGNPLHYLTYGQILIMKGDITSAVGAFRCGLKHGMHFDFVGELEQTGVRKPPVFRRLPRNHFINKYMGLMLKLLKLR
jgi:hypothetical protein